ncbi:hypothetical protein [Paenibacillus sp. NEAU-GSW1]|uniref:hypothetical protein n=1 Tax=Paenibacillus sp. NEAU-GSW1 TaxID=2682486 RepID=UPI0012E14087|nr:hypothetical protein [Paenibacillus sp. NEAU-GSW1]MUT67478.1 hypothetical protein [Paenibacillus sp. NEAU-GSW1]
MNVPIFVTLLILMIALPFLDLVDLIRKNNLLPYASLYIVAFGLAFALVFNPQLPGPLQLLHFLFDPIVKYYAQ